MKLEQSSKSIFGAPLNNLYVLWSMILDTYIVIKYQTGAIADHCFEAIT